MIYNLAQEENNIKLVFNESFIDSENMFSGLINITKINFIKFNALSTNMGYMFSGCSKLISLDLSNFDTSSVTNMERMFSSCNINLILCIYNNNLNYNLYNHLNTSDYNFKNNINCSHICFYESKKIILDTKNCV